MKVCSVIKVLHPLQRGQTMAKRGRLLTPLTETLLVARSYNCSVYQQTLCRQQRPKERLFNAERCVYRKSAIMLGDGVKMRTRTSMNDGALEKRVWQCSFSLPVN